MLRLTKPAIALLAAALTPLAPLGAAHAAATEAKSNMFWWPEKLNLTPLRKNADRANPYGDDFDYAEAFANVDLAALKADIDAVLTTSQDWWPADWGNYGPFFIRMAWHAAGTYRTLDGRGGADGAQQRFEPLNSWPDNGNLDKARRLLWPIKQKYGRSVSWGDLMVLAGNVALENMGFDTYGFAGGRPDDWEPELVYWGPEEEMLAGDKRYHGDRELEKPLAAVQMGLIYVNPEGPEGNPDPLAAAKDIRETFGRMAMNDEETVALIAGGHTFGKAHGAHKPGECLNAEPAAAGVEEQGLGWTNKCGKGNAEDTVTSGLEGAWSAAPTRWSSQYLDNLFQYEWVQTRSPAGAIQWEPKEDVKIVPDAHIKGKQVKPIMFTTDLSLKFDPEYRKISRRFQENPEEFQQAFARAWFKLMHRDLGPTARWVGDEVPEEELLWTDPLPKATFTVIDEGDISELKATILDSGLTVPQLVRTAWASASTFRASDMRGGANGARIRLSPQKDWDANDPDELKQVLKTYEKIQRRFNRSATGDKQVSMADLIVLGGAAAIEKAAADAGYQVTVPFIPGRVDATQDQTNVQSFAVLEPKADGFRNYYGEGAQRSPAELLVDKADLLHLTVPEMTVLIGGLRALDANVGGADHGVFTDRPGTLTNDFFVNLLDMDTQWAPADEAYVFEGRDRKSGEVKWTATEADLVFGSNSELRAVAEYYALADADATFVSDFITAWNKVMNADRFDLGDTAGSTMAARPVKVEEVAAATGN